MAHHCSRIRLLAVTLLTLARAQVLNLRFKDTDTDANQVGGSVIFDLPAAGHANFASYVVNFATGCSASSCVNGASAIGCTLGPQKAIVKAGAWTTVVDLAANQDITSGCSGTCTNLVVRSLDHDGSYQDDTCIRLFDSPSDYARTYYVTVAGETQANTARTALVTGARTQWFLIDMQMVATAVWDGGSSSVAETDFGDASTVIWRLVFPSGATDTQILSSLSSSSITPSPLPLAWTGSGATSLGLGVGQVMSVLGGHSPIRPDPDIAKHFVRSCIRLQMAYGATLNHLGEVQILSSSNGGAQTGIQDLSDVYMGYVTMSFSGAAVGTSDLTTVTGHATATSANCEQVDGVSLATCV